MQSVPLLLWNLTSVLITLGLLSSRRGSGYFVTKPACTPQPMAQAVIPSALDALSPDLYSGVSSALPVGSGWLPPEWYGDDILLDALKQSHAHPYPAPAWLWQPPGLSQPAPASGQQPVARTIQC